MTQKFIFRCTSNPKGPLFITDNFYEAEDMRKHPDYQEEDKDGNVIVQQKDLAPGRITFGAPAESARRPILTVKKK
jgi:hypothetical protein